MNVSNIFSVSFDEKFIATLNKLGFTYEVELDRLMAGHYVFQHVYDTNCCTTIWIGIDWKGRLVLDTLVQDFNKETEKSFWVRNTEIVFPILKNLETYINLVKYGYTCVFDFIGEQEEEDYIGSDEWINTMIKKLS